MKLKTLLLISLACLFPSVLFAQWQNVGNADYNWGPFHVYTISLYSESGSYTPDERPLMLSIKFAKPVEGKDFAITLMKEMESLKIPGLDRNTLVGNLQKILPDLQPGDTLSYIALADHGYFVLNDTILNHEFDQTFSQAFIDIWLSEHTNFTRLRERLIGKQPATENNAPAAPISQPENAPPSEENADPELIPKTEQSS